MKSSKLTRLDIQEEGFIEPRQGHEVGLGHRSSNLRLQRVFTVLYMTQASGKVCVMLTCDM
jgi:hypothetical protein